MTVKKYLLDILQEMLRPIRQKRAELAKEPEEVMKILRKGTEKANLRAEETLQMVKEAMKINYF